jgi:hypothetical protein
LIWILIHFFAPLFPKVDSKIEAKRFNSSPRLLSVMSVGVSVMLVSVMLVSVSVLMNVS